VNMDKRQNPCVQFLSPPADLRVGGLDTAIDGLGRALEKIGWQVVRSEEGDPLEQVDALHIHGLWRPKSRTLADEAIRRGIPYIVSPHGMLEPWARSSKRLKKSLYFSLRERGLLAKAARILTTSDQELRNLTDYAQALGPLCESLPLGIDPAPRIGTKTECRKALGMNQEERILLYLSRIDRKKGLDLLLRALASNEGSYDRLCVVGDGDETFLQELRDFEKANQKRLPKIDWLGAIWGEDKWRYLAAADVFCLPTHSENFGFAVLEALLVGTPVLTTDQTPWSEWGEGVVGIHIASPEVESLKRTLATVAETPTTGDLASWAADNFLWEKVVSGYDTLYRSLAANDSG